MYARAGEQVYTQPSLSPEHWYQCRQPGETITDLTNVSEREWIINTAYDPIESEVWLENWTSSKHVRLYGLSESKNEICLELTVIHIITAEKLCVSANHGEHQICINIICR